MTNYRIVQIGKDLYQAEKLSDPDGWWPLFKERNWESVGFPMNTISGAKTTIESHEEARRTREEHYKKYPTVVQNGFVDAYGKYHETVDYDR